MRNLITRFLEFYYERRDLIYQVSTPQKTSPKTGLRHFKWQPRFWDRIIRNEKELHKIQEYIVNNPLYFLDLFVP